MSERLESLPEDKRQKILQASLDEFAEHGYLNASTNRIVQAAGISKGLLFHYFGSKKKLFLYVLDHTIDHLIKKISAYSAPLSGEFFERARAIRDDQDPDRHRRAQNVSYPLRRLREPAGGDQGRTDGAVRAAPLRSAQIVYAEDGRLQANARASRRRRRRPSSPISSTDITSGTSKSIKR